jgi:hypothetical protein
MEKRKTSTATRVLLDLDRPLSIKKQKEVAAHAAGRRIQNTISGYGPKSKRPLSLSQSKINQLKADQDTLSAFSDNVRTVGTKKVKK